jgi:chromosome segregation ATPase
MSKPIEEISREQGASPTSIKEIILENFMSYEYARIPLRQGLNLVVGPNGAGKSSILLAISVALGQAYTERSRKLSDLIRRGREIARASLVFDNRERNGRRPIPYSKSDTFMLSRYLRKDGSYWFEADYKEIDKSEVVRLLGEFGINPDNLLIIMHQGMIEEFGATSPQVKLQMVEEAVGFKEYRERIFQAQNELKNLVGEESSLIQLIDNANQTIEYWKQIYDRFLERKKLVEHRELLQKELLWSNEAKLTKSLLSVQDRLTGKKRNLEDLKDQQRTAEEEGSKTYQGLLDKQTELRKLYFALVRAEKERSKAEGEKDAISKFLDDIEALIRSLNELVEKERIEPRKLQRMQSLIEYSTRKAKGQDEDEKRRKTELDREVTSLQADIGTAEDSIRKLTDSYIAMRVKFEVLSYRIRVTESEIKELQRSERELQSELDGLKPELELAGPRIETQRQPFEVSEELKLVSAQIQKLQDVPEDAEKIYKNYSGTIEELREKLKTLQENKSLILSELEERKKIWRNSIQSMLDEINPPYQQILASADATGLIRLDEVGDIEEAGLLLYVGYRGTAPSALDPYTQSGGERSVALTAFILSLQSSIVSPIRAMDEFDIHMDPKNRESMFRMIVSHMKDKQPSQYIVITPSILTIFDKTAHVITVQAVHGSSEVKEVKRQ